MPTVYFVFRDAPERRAALFKPDALDRYRYFGLDEIRARGADVQHNLERNGAPLWARAAGNVANSAVELTGGYGGDFASALASLRAGNDADVVFATADTVGIPLMLLQRARLLRTPLVYTPIGLPERLVQLRGDRTKRRYASALRGTHAVVTYSDAEAQWLREWVGGDASHITFVPFGVDVEAFRPTQNPPSVDIVSVGADPRRDFALLKDIATRRPDLSFRIVATKEHARALGSLPENLTLETDVPLEQVRDRLAAARVVALPVKRNSYSGATTVLLQSMALGKPVVVSRTDAVASGYGLEDGINVRLVEPGDPGAFEQALLQTLADPGSLGERGRATVEREFTWERYTGRLWDILSGAWEREPS